MTVANEVKRDDGVKVTLAFEGGGARAFQVPGHNSRLGQVIDNLIDNARSFSPPGGTVRVTCRRLKNEVEIMVDDDGPGVRPDAVEKIFERFYTDRPHQGFGQNSGLGLSISKQIVEAHGGAHLGREPDRRLGCAGTQRRAESRWRPLHRAPAGDVMAADATIHASAVLVGCTRGVDPRSVRRRQIAPCAGTHRGCTGGPLPFADSSVTIACICRDRVGACWCVRPPR